MAIFLKLLQGRGCRCAGSQSIHVYTKRVNIISFIQDLEEDLQKDGPISSKRIGSSLPNNRKKHPEQKQMEESRHSNISDEQSMCKKYFIKMQLRFILLGKLHQKRHHLLLVVSLAQNWYLRFRWYQDKIMRFSVFLIYICYTWHNFDTVGIYLTAWCSGNYQGISHN